MSNRLEQKSTSADSLHLSVPLVVVDFSCFGFGLHVWCNDHQHAITTTDNFVNLTCSNDHIIRMQIEKGIDNIEFQCQNDLAMLLIRAKTQVFVRDKSHPSPDDGQMPILCVTRDLSAFKEFINHFKSSKRSVAIKPMDIEKFKMLFNKYFDSDGNVLPSGKINNPLSRTQFLSRKSPPTYRYGNGKEIYDEVSANRRRKSLDLKRSDSSSDLANDIANDIEIDLESSTEFSLKFTGTRLKKKYKSPTDTVTYSSRRSSYSPKSSRTFDDDFIISPNKRRNSLISSQRQKMNSFSNQVEETDMRFRRKYRSSTNSIYNKETSPTYIQGKTSRCINPVVVILDSSPDRGIKRRDPTSELFYYYCVGYSSVLITGADYNRLVDMDELNDNLIVFYMRKESNEIYDQMSRWIKKKKIDLFDFQYVFIPICEQQAFQIFYFVHFFTIFINIINIYFWFSGHWYLALIINPTALEVNRTADCHIAIFDSIAESFKHNRTVHIITNFLFEYTRDTKQVTIERASRIPCSLVNSPKQKNNVDCGIYVLHFTETFMWNSEVLKRQIIKGKTEEDSWDPYDDLPNKRHSILAIIDSLADKYASQSRS
ncbi:10543_t:CDS:2 [Scutellospora calospora]|uniref:10543_t:CDS:1 n=1 Tax=Scutellospora calospora TaxID=85575 RepID=A0ACA9KGL3_9GLOM|nr:10543_t:CDS:2 [Scutellospora calospora]